MNFLILPFLCNSLFYFVLAWYIFKWQVCLICFNLVTDWSVCLILPGIGSFCLISFHGSFSRSCPKAYAVIICPSDTVFWYNCLAPSVDTSTKHMVDHGDFISYICACITYRRLGKFRSLWPYSQFCSNLVTLLHSCKCILTFQYCSIFL